jgi:hypothetical protein
VHEFDNSQQGRQTHWVFMEATFDQGNELFSVEFEGCGLGDQLV